MSDSGYRCVVTDPPWKVAAGREIGDYVRAADGSQPFGVRSDSARRLAYPSMSVDDIAATFPSDCLADDCHLYLWTINAYLAAAFDLLAGWEFKFSTLLVWAKAPMGGGLGGCYGLATEYCLFGYRGKQAAQGRIGRNWWTWRRPYDERGKPKHSAKPSEFFEMVEGISQGPYLEMYARAPRDGWDVWGNEVASDVTLSPTGGRQAPDDGETCAVCGGSGTLYHSKHGGFTCYSCGGRSTTRDRE